MNSLRKKRYHATRRTYLIGAALVIIIAAIIAAAVLLSRISSSPKTEAPGPPSDDLKAAPAAGQSYIDDTLFIGDSRTMGLFTYGLLPEKQVLAVDGMNHQTARTKKFVELSGETLTIAEAMGRLKPPRAIVSFGINGIDFFGEKDFIAEYEGLMSELSQQSPDTVFIIQSILPVSSELSLLTPGMANTVIKRHNTLLRELARAHGFLFLNTAEALSTPEGSLLPECDAGDGLHLTRNAYDIILDYVETHPVP